MHANRLMPNVYRKKLLAFTIYAICLKKAAAGKCLKSELYHILLFSAYMAENA